MCETQLMNLRFYNAHETSAVEDFAAALLCGEADFKVRNCAQAQEISFGDGGI